MPVLRSLIDTLPSWLLFPLLLAVFLNVAEITYRMGVRQRERSTEHKKSHAGLILGSLLALLGLLLAFTFSIAESRYQTRKQLVLDQANAIATTYLRADMLPDGRIEPTKDLLRDYVDLQLHVHTSPELRAALHAAGPLQQSLWAEAVASAKEDSVSRYIPLFVQSLNEVIDLHESRLTYAVHYRLPVPILWALFAVSLFAMAVLGYVSGLGGTRSFWPTLAIVAAIAAVLVLVVELDRPWQRLFEVSQASMADVRADMSDEPVRTPR